MSGYLLLSSGKESDWSSIDPHWCCLQCVVEAAAALDGHLYSGRDWKGLCLQESMGEEFSVLPIQAESVHTFSCTCSAIVDWGPGRNGSGQLYRSWKLSCRFISPPLSIFGVVNRS